MNKTRIISITLLILSLGLGYFLYLKIQEPIEEKARIRGVEARVIAKLKLIRDAQKSYQIAYGKYTSDWDSLQDFVSNGIIYNIQRKEIVVTLSYGRDSSLFRIDTLGIVKASDSIFNEKNYPDVNISELSNIPFTGKKFELFADKIQRGNVFVDVFEVKDVDPVNPMRRQNNMEKALRVGSRTEVTTSGNWE